MSRARLLLLAVSALAAAACGDSTAPAATIAFRQPAALAVFNGYTIEDGTNLRPYLVVANASRNDLTVIDATDDTPVEAPVDLRALVIPVPDRPALLASASLGDGAADLLVAVSAGSSQLQLIRTWTAANAVVEDATVELGQDVLALAAIPSPAGTARIAAALADRRLAVVQYTRSNGEIVPLGPVVHDLGFQAVALAAVPGDEAHVYAASPEPFAGGVLGVGEIDVSAPSEPWSVRPLDARGPTRLVAGARLRERKDDATSPGAAAFEGQPLVSRVYAVLDESGCGPDHRIDCGVVTLDPAKTTGGDAIPEDWAGRMPYRAPIRVRGRTLALSVAHPPEAAPPDAPIYQGDLMRVFAGTIEEATTAVAAVASDNGDVYFLDLGRFKALTVGSALSAIRADVAEPTRGADGKRLWIQDDGGAFAANAAAASGLVDVTPGYTRDAIWTVAWQGVLSADVGSRAAEAGLVAPGVPWLALQRGEGEVVKLYHPALGVRAGAEGVGDIATIVGGTIEGCPTAVTALEARVDALLAPTDAYPGGAVQLAREAGASADQQACFDALLAKISSQGGVATRLTASIRARELVLTSLVDGYAGRPPLGAAFSLEYPAAGEDSLSCSLADWDGRFPPADPSILTCGGGGCDRAVCEQLVLARQSRRVHHGFEDCALDPADTDCAEVWQGITFPIVNGPALGFRVGVEGGDGVAERDMVLSITTASGAAPSFTRPSPAAPQHASGGIAFDRSPVNAAAGYRFLFSYPSDFVFDASPSITPVDAIVIR